MPIFSKNRVKMSVHEKSAHLHINISNKMISKVVAYVHLLDFTILSTKPHHNISYTELLLNKFYITKANIMDSIIYCIIKLIEFRFLRQINQGLKSEMVFLHSLTLSWSSVNTSSKNSSKCSCASTSVMLAATVTKDSHSHHTTCQIFKHHYFQQQTESKSRPRKRTENAANTGATVWVIWMLQHASNWSSRVSFGQNSSMFFKMERIQIDNY